MTPTELVLHRKEKTLDVTFADGVRYTLPAELLRVESPSAEVRGHGGSGKRLVPGRRRVGILEVKPVGNYAVQIKFDDLHDTGIYTWTYLRELGEQQNDIMARYVTALEAAGLSRDP